MVRGSRMSRGMKKMLELNWKQRNFLRHKLRQNLRSLKIHIIPRSNSLGLALPAVNFQDIAIEFIRRARRQCQGLGIFHDADDPMLGVDENYVERDIGILHPKRSPSILKKQKEHAPVCSEPVTIHQAAQGLFGTVGDFDLIAGPLDFSTGVENRDVFELGRTVAGEEEEQR